MTYISPNLFFSYFEIDTEADARLSPAVVLTTSGLYLMKTEMKQRN
jgi:hypothetical protein